MDRRDFFVRGAAAAIALDRFPYPVCARATRKSASDRGITFWDSADQYGTLPHLKEALKSVPRDKVTILSKTHASTEKEMKAAGKGVIGMKILGAGKLRRNARPSGQDRRRQSPRLDGIGEPC